MKEDSELKGMHIAWLRERASFQERGAGSPSRFANILGITTRTLSKWESGNLTIPQPYLPTIQLLFEKYCLIPFAWATADRAYYNICESEFIAIWFVRNMHTTGAEGFRSSEAILLEDTARYKCLYSCEEERKKCKWACPAYCTDYDRCFRTDRQHKPLAQRSLTTAPLRSGRAEKLSGNAIEGSQHKRMPGRWNHFYWDHTVHTLLHVPLLVEGPDHPQAVALLSMENRLDQEGTGLRPHDECEYDQGHEQKAVTLLRDAFWDKPWPTLRPDETSIPYSGNMVQHLYVFGYLEWLPLQDLRHEQGDSED